MLDSVKTNPAGFTEKELATISRFIRAVCDAGVEAAILLGAAKLHGDSLVTLQAVDTAREDLLWTCSSNEPESGGEPDLDNLGMVFVAAASLELIITFMLESPLSWLKQVTLDEELLDKCLNQFFAAELITPEVREPGDLPEDWNNNSN